MASHFHRFVIGQFARNRSEQRWLLRSLRDYMRHVNDGNEHGAYRYRRTRTARLAFAQFLMCEAMDRPVFVLLGPAVAILAYLLGLAFMFVRH
jgi:hypothetical protein